MTTVAAPQPALELLALSRKAAGWEPVGLQTGGPLAAASRIAVCHDPGHAATERPGVARLYAAVAGDIDTAIDLTANDSDPWA